MTPSGRKLLGMFPGQGSQYVGMGKQLLSEFPYTKSVFEEAEDAARIPVRRLCLEGPEEELKLTAFTQPAILTVSVATWTVLSKETGITPDIFAGHSLGEYSALVAAGKLPFGRAVHLVNKRGEAMQRAVPEGRGGMAAVLNFDEQKLQARCKEATRPGEPIEIANYNSPAQLVVAGHIASLDRLLTVLESQDSVKAVRLAVSAPFHSSMMSKAREEMTPLLQGSPLTKNERVIIPNVTGEPTAFYEIDGLINQIDSPVRWTQTMQSAMSAQCQVFLEIGPGRVLFGLGRRLIPKDSKIAHTDDIVAAVKEFATF